MEANLENAKIGVLMTPAQKGEFGVDKMKPALPLPGDLLSQRNLRAITP